MSRPEVAKKIKHLEAVLHNHGMDDLKRMAVFACVVRHRSMSAAARELHMSTSAVSQQMRQLERDGGVTLLHRSTRRLTLTDAGERFYVDCAAMVQAAERARADLAASRDAPSGELRLSAPVGFARHVAPALRTMLATHPALTLTLLVDDARVDLIESRIDLAIRFGNLPDSGWAARRISRFAVQAYAAPSYLAGRPVPRGPDDLLAEQWLGFVREGRTVTAALLHGTSGAQRSVRVEPRIASNNQWSLQQMCVAGLGLAMLGAVDVHEDLASGALVPVLSEWQMAPLDVWAVTPQRDAQPAKVRHAIAALETYLRDLPGTST